MKQEWYSLTKAAELLDTDFEGITHVVSTGKLRAGVIAKHWEGVWTPEEAINGFADNRTENGDRVRYYHWEIRGGDKKTITKEFKARGFWYLQRSEIEDLFNLSGNREIDLSLLEPTLEGHKFLMDSPSPLATERGFFWISADQLNRRIGIDDLLIHGDDIERFNNTPTHTLLSVKDQRIDVVRAVLKSMEKIGSFNPTSKSWPKTDIWKECVKRNNILFPNNKADKQEGGFHKAYTAVKATYKSRK